MKEQNPISIFSASPVAGPFEGPVGIFVDGENLQSWVAPKIVEAIGQTALVRLSRVYGNCTHLHEWHAVAGFDIVHTGVAGNGGSENVKNVADMKIAVDVMEFALLDQGKTIILCSSDRDFTPLVWSLRRLARTVIGIGEAKASESYKKACHRFVTVTALKQPAPTEPVKHPASARTSMDEKIYRAVEKLGGRGKGCPIEALNPEMRTSESFKISSLKKPADRQWRKYLANRPDTYRLDPKGPAARVWIIDGATKGQ